MARVDVLKNDKKGDEKDDENIEKEFEENQIQIEYPEPNIWHYMFIFFLTIFSWYTLWSFSPFFSPIQVRDLFNKTCCQKVHNLTVCFFKNNCEYLLKTYSAFFPFNREECCYWVSKYAEKPENWQKICLGECFF
jgi:hypothetical protein